MPYMQGLQPHAETSTPILSGSTPVSDYFYITSNIGFTSISSEPAKRTTKCGGDGGAWKIYHHIVVFLPKRVREGIPPYRLLTPPHLPGFAGPAFPNI